MTQLIRQHRDTSQSGESLEQVHQSGHMATPEICAKFFAWILMQTDDQRFQATFWDIYEKSYQKEWSGEAVFNPLDEQ